MTREYKDAALTINQLINLDRNIVTEAKFHAWRNVSSQEYRETTRWREWFEPQQDAK